MTIATIHFDKDKADFSKLLKVWEYSARKHHPNARVEILKVPAPEVIPSPCNQFMTYTSNYAFIKMCNWALKQNDDVIMTDADIMFTGNCESAFDKINTIGVTVRKAPAWINAGVVFKKQGIAADNYLIEVVNLVKKIVERPQDYIEYLCELIGADQSALAILTIKYNFTRLLCSEYNLEQTTWQWFSPATKIVHMKSSLWDLVQGQTPRIGATPENHVYEIFDIWKSYLKAATK